MPTDRILLLFCVLAALLFAMAARASKARWPLYIYGALPLVFMVGQLLCLRADGLMNARTALPLHLCGFSGLLCLPAALGSASCARFLRRLGVIGALTALCFPAMLSTSHPMITALFFYLLHAFILFFPLAAPKKKGGRSGALLIAALLLAGAALTDAVLGANYLFLRVIPTGTPFSFLAVLSPALRAALWGAVMTAALMWDTQYIRRNKT